MVWSIGLLKVITISLLRATPVALFAGSVKVTVGKVISGIAPLVKLQI